MKPAQSGKNTVTIVIPAKNEEQGLRTVLPRLKDLYPQAEIIVVDDASTDNTAEICRAHAVTVIRHPYSVGNGGAIKTGARIAAGDILVFLDGDGQHDPADVARLLEKLDQGFDMAVGARSNGSQAGLHRATANTVYNRLASWMTGRRVEDLTSGLRAARANKFREFLYLLPNGFSYPTTITMSFFRAGYTVAYVPVHAATRKGRSHIRLVRDGVRFLLIIFRVGTLYSPLKLFVPISLAVFVLGLGYYMYTFFHYGRFTNMTALLFISSLLIFLIGLVSEQVTMLLYRGTSENK